MSEIDVVIAELTRAGQSMTPGSVEALSEAVRSHSRVFSYATGRSGLMIKSFAMRLMQLGFVSFVVGETTTPSLSAGDLLVVASASGETESVVSAARLSKKVGADLFVISSLESSSLAEVWAPDAIIRSGTKYATSAVSIQPLGSLFEQALLIYLDSVSLHLSSMDGESQKEMAARHASIE